MILLGKLRSAPPGVIGLIAAPVRPKQNGARRTPVDMKTGILNVVGIIVFPDKGLGLTLSGRITAGTTPVSETAVSHS